MEPHNRSSPRPRRLPFPPRRVRDRIVQWANTLTPADNTRSRELYALKPMLSLSVNSNTPSHELAAWLAWNDSNGEYDECPLGALWAHLWDVCDETERHIREWVARQSYPDTFRIKERISRLTRAELEECAYSLARALYFSETVTPIETWSSETEWDAGTIEVAAEAVPGPLYDLIVNLTESEQS